MRVAVEGRREMGGEELNLLVACSLEPAVVYRRVCVRGLQDSHCLPDSDSRDAVLSALVADIDFDGQNEVILGTYGQVRNSIGLLDISVGQKG